MLQKLHTYVNNGQIVLISIKSYLMITHQHHHSNAENKSHIRTVLGLLFFAQNKAGKFTFIYENKFLETRI